MTTEPSPILDDLARMQSVDKRNMLRIINELPEQCETALGITRSFAIDPLPTQPNVVFITGVGDSGIAADMAAAVLGEEIDIPIMSDHGGRLPKCVGQDALVFVVDYLGKNQSVLRNYRDAKQRGATVICITTGGKLLEAASKDGGKTIKIPPGQSHRSAIGYLFVPFFAAIEKLGLAEGLTEKLSHAIKLMKNIRESFRFENPTARNVAKQTATAMFETLPSIYGVPGYRAAVASRWKSQLNANCKILAMDGTFPDMTESEISGWEMASKQCDKFAAILLKDKADRNDITDLMDASAELLENVGVTEVEMKGNTTLEKTLYGAYLGDYVSYYLSLLYEVDPSVTENISLIESKLTESGSTE